MNTIYDKASDGKQEEIIGFELFHWVLDTESQYTLINYGGMGSGGDTYFL